MKKISLMEGFEGQSGVTRGHKIILKVLENSRAARKHDENGFF